MAVPENIEQLAYEVRKAIHGVEVREALASSMEATADVADWARDVAQQIVDGNFNEGALQTEIERKLNQLEQDYAPKLMSIEGEVDAARGSSASLVDRLDSRDKVLAEKASQADLNTTNQNITKKASKIELQNALEPKMNRGEDIVVSQIDKNLGLLDETYFTDETKQQWAGNTPIHATPANKTITRTKVVNKAISPAQTDFMSTGKNMINKDAMILGKTLNGTGGLMDASYGVTDYIEVKSGEAYALQRARNHAFYDQNLDFISYDNTNTNHDPITITAPQDGYIRISVYEGYINEAQMEKGTTHSNYEPYGVKLENLLPSPSINPLVGKKLFNFGDSIAAGDGNSGIGYGELIAQKNNMVVSDYAVGGATVMVESDTTNNIVKQVDDVVISGEIVDYILFNGGTNDAVRDSSLYGQISAGYTATLDTSTFCGAFEYICKTLKTKWLGAKIIYVRPHNMNTRDERQVTLGELSLEMCKKWSIPTMDLYEKGGLNTHIVEMKNSYCPDGTHPNGLGYENYYVPPIESQMKSI